MSTFKPIKLVPANTEAIDALLGKLNGKATQHTYSVSDLLNEAERIEAKLERLGLPKAERVGAAATVHSGDTVPNAYKWARTGAWAKLERRSTGWFLVGYRTCDLWKSPAKDRIVLTAQQDAEVVRRVREQYQVAAADAVLAGSQA